MLLSMELSCPCLSVQSHEYDMKTLNVIEYGTGLDIGYLISDKEMELILQVNEVDGLTELCTLQKIS